MSKQTVEYIFNKKLPILKKDWKGNLTVNGLFYNKVKESQPALSDVFKWKFGKNPQKTEKKQDNFKLNRVELTDFSKNENKIVWLGHASFLITVNGVSFLTDPCLTDIPFIKRRVDVPCKISDLKNVDYLLLSHDHRDHFDVKSLQQIVTHNPTIEALMPLGMSKLLKKSKLNAIKSQEAGWYQEYIINHDVSVVFVPSKHWCKRGLTDFNTILWGGFLIRVNGKNIYFSGDTAYDKDVFKDIESVFGKMDICMLPIGAYSPSFMMKDAHTTPEEAFQIFKDLKGELCIPMHYGTYDLSDEPLGEPIKRFKTCFDALPNKLKRVDVGEVFEL